MARRMLTGRQRDDLFAALDAAIAFKVNATRAERAREREEQPPDPVTSFEFVLLCERLGRAVSRDGQVSNWPDGYPPSSSVAGSGGGLRVSVEADEHGPDESIEMTSVEMAILTRERNPRDEHHDLVLGACSDLDAAVESLNRLVGKLAAIDHLIVETPRPDQEHGCRSCARLVDGSGRAHFEHADGRRGLCQFCDGWEQTHDGLPPREILDRKARGQRITQNVVDEVIAAQKRKAG